VACRYAAALIIIYSQNTILFYIFRASSAHLQEDIVVYKQHMVPSLYIRVPGGLSIRSCTDYYLFTKYYSPLHVSSIKCSSSGEDSCIRAAYDTVTLYKSSLWPVDTQLATYRQATRTLIESDSTICCLYTTMSS